MESSGRGEDNIWFFNLDSYCPTGLVLKFWIKSLGTFQTDMLLDESSLDFASEGIQGIYHFCFMIVYYIWLYVAKYMRLNPLRYTMERCNKVQP